MILTAVGPSRLGMNDVDDAMAYSCPFIRTWATHSPETRVIIFTQSTSVYKAWSTEQGPLIDTVHVLLTVPLPDDTDGWSAWRFW
jgi:hypothetical protein